MAKSPRIMDHLEEISLSNFKFVRPSKETGEIRAIHAEDTETSLASETLLILSLNLRGERIIPFHLNTEKEKWYRLLAGDSVEVLAFRFGKVERYWMKKSGDELIMPSGTWHGVINHSIDSCLIRIVASIKADDCIWEPETYQLLLNERGA